MSMILSKRCLHGLRAVLYLSLHDGVKKYFSVRAISHELHIPYHFMSKILQDLTREGVLVSSRGISGGVRLAQPLENIDLLNIIDLLEGPDFLRGCVLGFSVCSDESPCALHEKWSGIRDAMLELFSSESLDKIAERIEMHHLTASPALAVEGEGGSGPGVTADQHHPEQHQRQG